MDQIRKALQHFTDFPNEEWEDFSRHLVFQQFNREEHLCSEGQVENYIYYLSSGATRSYFLKDGRDYTLDFSFANDFVSCFTSFLTREPSQVSLQAIENIETWKIHHRYIYELYDRYHYSERLGRLVTEMQFVKRSRKEMELLSLTAEQRYRNLFMKDPSLVSRISVKHLSSYLGIHPESLSRIRSKVSGKN